MPKKNQIPVNTLEQATQRQQASRIEEMCFDQAKQIMESLPLNTFGQIEMAFAIIKHVRLEFGLINRTPEYKKFLSTFYNIKNIDFRVEYDLLRSSKGEPNTIEKQKSKISKTVCLENSPSIAQPRADSGNNKKFHFTSNSIQYHKHMVENRNNNQEKPIYEKQSSGILEPLQNHSKADYKNQNNYKSSETSAFEGMPNKVYRNSNYSSNNIKTSQENSTIQPNKGFRYTAMDMKTNPQLNTKYSSYFNEQNKGTFKNEGLIKNTGAFNSTSNIKRTFSLYNKNNNISLGTKDMNNFKMGNNNNFGMFTFSNNIINTDNGQAGSITGGRTRSINAGSKQGQGIMNFHSNEEGSMFVKNNPRGSNFGSGKKSTDSNKFLGGNNIGKNKVVNNTHYLSNYRKSDMYK